MYQSPCGLWTFLRHIRNVCRIERSDLAKHRILIIAELSFLRRFQKDYDKWDKNVNYTAFIVKTEKFKIEWHILTCRVACFLERKFLVV